MNESESSLHCLSANASSRTHASACSCSVQVSRGLHCLSANASSRTGPASGARGGFAFCLHCLSANASSRTVAYHGTSSRGNTRLHCLSANASSRTPFFESSAVSLTRVSIAFRLTRPLGLVVEAETAVDAEVSLHCLSANASSRTVNRLGDIPSNLVVVSIAFRLTRPLGLRHDEIKGFGPSLCLHCLSANASSRTNLRQEH